MKAAIHNLYSPDVSDLESWYPEDPDCFALLVTVLAGPQGGIGKESFDFVVCTPEWIRREYGSDAVVSGRSRLLVFDYDFKKILRKIEGIVESISGDSWVEVATKLSRYAAWEFEDYQESQVRPS